MPDALLVALVLGPVDFAHTRINGRQHTGGAGFAPGALRHGGQRGNANHWQFGAQRQPLGDTDADAHAGKAARTAAKGQRVQLAQRGAALGEDLLHQRQDTLGMFAGTNFEMSTKGAIIPQSRGAGLCGGIDSQNSHGWSRSRYIVQAFRQPDFRQTANPPPCRPKSIGNR